MLWVVPAGTSSADGARFWECRCSQMPKGMASLATGGNFAAKASNRGRSRALFALHASCWRCSRSSRSCIASVCLECVPVLSGRRDAMNRASVVRAASCSFAERSAPVRVASFPRRRIFGWRREVPEVTGVARVAEVGARPDAQIPWPPFWGTNPRWIQNPEERKTHPPPQA